MGATSDSSDAKNCEFHSGCADSLRYNSCWNVPVASAFSGDVFGSRNVRSAFVTCAARATGSSATVSTVVVVVGNAVVVVTIVVLATPAVVLLEASCDAPLQPARKIATKMGSTRRTGRD